ncbi:hypothetical protein CKO44_24170 [Rubrivivax gelatinosus]|uniref:TetR/AcrR family transcriptional regulator n=1 Tax=Rubrivivax gelatinosus TaxID=28068 RepID=UPI001908EB71|nr:TetR/AcrR family transcriptional regulator [Rubrivivax gelatinosus]MBK1616541.1 hypothetical protein [Rubrivivax gelatinosus]MBZ8142895.1 TetR family transcriptional regulator [Rubrivivax gelatinosus]
MSNPLSSTAERILDAAEALFAEQGYDGVSVRAITDTAGVRLNLLSYHFGTKAALFEAVIDRRLDVLNERRREALAALAQRKATPAVEDLLVAFIRPYLELAARGGPGWISYTRLIAQICQSDVHSPLLENHMKETLDLFIDALSKVLPDAGRKNLTRGFYFTIALMVSAFSGAGRIDGLVQGQLDDEALDVAYRPLLTYTTAGLLSLCRLGA